MLSKDQLVSFEENGYLVIENVFDQFTVLDPLRAEYDSLLDILCRKWVNEGRLEAVPDGLSFEEKLLISYRAKCDWFRPFDISLPGGHIHADTPMHIGNAVFNMITCPRLLDIVQDLLGEEITSIPIQHIRIKPPVSNLHKDEVRSYITSTDWHQDRGVVLEEADKTDMITVWCAVTDSTVENGCLQVLPGVHREGLKPHCPRTSLRSQMGIAEGYIDKDKAVPLPVKSGGVVILHPLTPHASLVNETDNIRWSFDIRFCVTGHPTGRAHFPAFVARSRVHPQRVLTSAALWRAMWEDTRARLAGKPHIDIHRWSSDSPACA